MGGSMAGLLAARVLADYYDRVTIIERDSVSEWAEPRKGTPQDRHVHGFWARGLETVERLFPGVTAELHGGGAVPGDAVGDVNWHQFGGLKLRAPTGIGATLMTRPFLESHVRRRALALPTISLRAGTTVTDLTTSEEHRRVSGVYVLGPGGAREVIEADLVIDATGRGTQAPRWLEFMGYQRPPETAVRVDLAYVTRTFRRNTNQPTIGHIIIGTPPAWRRGGFCFAVEDDRWQVTLVGFLGEEPPTDAEGFAGYARSLPTSEIHEVVHSCEPIDEARLYKFASNLRRHYERLAAFPEGYLVIGDALCSFNPAYGQGMTVAALEVEALESCLAADTSPSMIAPQFFTRAAAVIDVPWRLTTGEDFRYPEVVGKRPPLLNLLNAYVTRVHHAATVDPVVCRAFFEVASLTRRPERLLAPEILWRVLTARPRQTPDPAAALAPSR